MSAANFETALAFVWQAGFDSPLDGYHTTPGDLGGGTLGGVIEATWRGAQARGLVPATTLLCNATIPQLQVVLRDEFWGPACDAMPAGLDLLLFNGRMMTGMYPAIVQRAVHVQADGVIGPETMRAVHAARQTLLIDELTAGHVFYLSGLSTWDEFRGGWFNRILRARDTALGMLT